MSAPEDHRTLGPLTPDEARDLAARWVWWRSGGSDSLPNPTTTTQLPPYMRAMLRRYATLRRYWASRLGHDLGLAATPGDTDEETPAYRLCELAGWPS